MSNRTGRKRSAERLQRELRFALVLTAADADPCICRPFCKNDGVNGCYRSSHQDQDPPGGLCDHFAPSMDQGQQETEVSRIATQQARKIAESASRKSG